MRFVNNISMLCVLLLLLATACAHNQVPEVQVYKEIPFIDAPEAAFVWTLSHKEGIIGSVEWQKIRPFVLCVDDKGWTEIKKGWLQACVMAGPDCNAIVHTIDEMVHKLDDLASKILPAL